MHDSKNAVSVQNTAATLAAQFDVVPETVFAEAFWQTVCREWAGLDSHRINKILLLVRLVVRRVLAEGRMEVICAYALSPRERKVPDGLRYHVLDLWVEEVERSVAETGGRDEEVLTRLMRPVWTMAQEGSSKGVRVRAKEVLVEAEGKGLWREEMK